MIVNVLNKNFEWILLIEEYTSLIWTDRYSECGDFELVMAMNNAVYEKIEKGFYISIAETNRMMIVEQIEVKDNGEDGMTLTYSGRSAEAILAKRVVWGQLTFEDKNVVDIIVQLLNTQFVNPTDPDRKIPGFFVDDEISEVKRAYEEDIMSAQYFGDTVLSAIEDLAQERHIGFRLTCANGLYVFSLYRGKNRSYDQNENAYVVFSDVMGNITESNYAVSIENGGNVAFVAGESDNDTRPVVGVGNASGFERSELYVDASKKSKKDDSGATMSEAKYAKILKKEGQKALRKNKEEKVFDAKLSPIIDYRYQVDFDLGDIVQHSTSYGAEVPARVTEMIFCSDGNGYAYYPTLEAITDGGD